MDSQAERDEAGRKAMEKEKKVDARESGNFLAVARDMD